MIQTQGESNLLAGHRVFTETPGEVWAVKVHGDSISGAMIGFGIVWTAYIVYAILVLSAPIWFMALFLLIGLGLLAHGLGERFERVHWRASRNQLEVRVRFVGTRTYRLHEAFLEASGSFEGDSASPAARLWTLTVSSPAQRKARILATMRCSEVEARAEIGELARLVSLATGWQVKTPWTEGAPVAEA